MEMGEITMESGERVRVHKDTGHRDSAIWELYEFQSGTDYKGSPFEGWYTTGIKIYGKAAHTFDNSGGTPYVYLNCSSHHEETFLQMDRYRELYGIAIELAQEAYLHLVGVESDN